MSDKERITSPSMGSNELGRDTAEEHPSDVAADSNAQLRLAELSHKKNNKVKKDKKQ